MTQRVLEGIALTIFLAIPAAAQGQIACTREGLQKATDLYLEAQSAGDTSRLPIAKGLAYIENLQGADIAAGVIRKPLRIDFHRTIIDVPECQSFTELIVTDKSHPYVIGTRVRVNRDKVAEIESLVTQQGDWLFNADNYMKWSPGEDWGLIPAVQRDNRATLVAAANAYLDAFLEGKGDAVPWGYPCNRTEGGLRTGKGVAEDSCQVGVPSGVNIVARRFVVDEALGAVVAFCTFGVGGLPDTHLFRVEKGKLRFVHTLTHVPPGRQVPRGPAGGTAAPPANPK